MIYKPQGTNPVAGCLQGPERASQLGHTYSTQARHVASKNAAKGKGSIKLINPFPFPCTCTHQESWDSLRAHSRIASKLRPLWPALSSRKNVVLWTLYSYTANLTTQMSHSLVLAWPNTYRSQCKDEQGWKLALCSPVMEFHHQRIWSKLFLLFSLIHTTKNVLKVGGERGRKPQTKKSPNNWNRSSLMSWFHSHMMDMHQ